MKFLPHKVFILSVGLLLLYDPVFSQVNTDLSVGFGGPELAVLKIRYGNHIKIGASQGFMIIMPYEGYQGMIGPTMAEIYYHFTGKSKYDTQPPWYLFGSIGYWIGENYLFCCPRLGRSFYLSEKLGINIDLGALIPLNENYRENLPSPVIPSGSICFFFRL